MAFGKKIKEMISDDDNNEDSYFKIIAKKGGIIPSRKTNRLSKNDRIAIDNNKELHNFVKQMNEKQAKIFLKLIPFQDNRFV